MFSTSSTVFTAKCQARALAAVVGDSSRHRFMVGTCSVREMNEIVIVDFDEETNALSSAGSLVHPGEVSIVCPSPYDVSLLATHGRYRDGEAETVVWSCPDLKDVLRSRTKDVDDDDQDDQEEGVSGRIRQEWASDRPMAMERAAVLSTTGPAAAVLWCPKEHSSSEKLATVDECDGSARFWDSLKEVSASVALSHRGDRANAAAWSPHSIDQVAVATDASLVAVDRRAATRTLLVECPHDGAALDVDYNPNKPYCLATAGDDGCVKFWDSRKTNTTLKVLSASKNIGGGSHWLTAVRYNRFHDQLVASAGTDRAVHLWRVSSISSAPLLEAAARDDDDDDDEQDQAEPPQQEEDTQPPAADNNDDDKGAPQSSSAPAAPEATAPDLKVKTYDHHDDSVYGLAWSACDAWVFAGLSYDGRLVLNHVPSPEKYKILL